MKPSGEKDLRAIPRLLLTKNDHSFVTRTTGTCPNSLPLRCADSDFFDVSSLDLLSLQCRGLRLYFRSFRFNRVSVVMGFGLSGIA